MKESEEYKIEREFSTQLGYQNDSDDLEMLSKFKTYLIEQGEQFTAKQVEWAISEHLKALEPSALVAVMTNRIKELEKEVQQYRDNTFLENYKSAIDDRVKVVIDADVEQYFHDNFDCYADSDSDLPYSAMTKESVVKMAKWMQEKLTGKA